MHVISRAAWSGDDEPAADVLDRVEAVGCTRAHGREALARLLYMGAVDMTSDRRLTRPPPQRRMFHVERRIRWAADGWPFWLRDLLNAAVCRLFGHIPTRDQCGDPTHDYCMWCAKAMPGAWNRSYPWPTVR